VGLWAFVAAVAACDVAFAVTHRDGFADWELNPLMRGLGVWGACAYRVATVALGAALCLVAGGRARGAATAVVFLAHALLAGVLLHAALHGP
jgi:hypothetical protein